MRISIPALVECMKNFIANGKILSKIYDNPIYKKIFVDDLYLRKSKRWWVLTSGILLDLNAKENFLGKVKLDDDSLILDGTPESLKSTTALKNKIIYVVLWDGESSFEDIEHKLMKLSENYNEIKILMVGELKAPISFPYETKKLFNEQTDYEFLIRLQKVKREYWINYNLNRLRHILMPIKNMLKHPLISFQYYFKSGSIVFFGAIGPSQNQINAWHKRFQIEKIEIEELFSETKDLEEIAHRIFKVVKIKYRDMGNLAKQNSDRVWLEFMHALVRCLTLTYFEQIGVRILCADYHRGQSFNAYQSYFGKTNQHIDFGSKVTNDIIYPRRADVLALKKEYFSIPVETIIKCKTESEILNTLKKAFSNVVTRL